MKNVAMLIIIVVWSGVVGCTEPNITLETSYGSKVRYSGLGPSYSWVTGDASKSSPEFHDLIVGTIDDGLRAKGFVKEPAGKDFLVDYAVTRKERMDTTGSVAGEAYPEGTLVFRVSDAKNGERIWSAVARARIVESMRPEERAEKIKACLAQILKEFPAKSGTGQSGK